MLVELKSGDTFNGTPLCPHSIQYRERRCADIALG
jgi:hypothetical protein